MCRHSISCCLTPAARANFVVEAKPQRESRRRACDGSNFSPLFRSRKKMPNPLSIARTDTFMPSNTASASQNSWVRLPFSGRGFPPFPTSCSKLLNQGNKLPDFSRTSPLGKSVRWVAHHAPLTLAAWARRQERPLPALVKYHYQPHA